MGHAQSAQHACDDEEAESIIPRKGRHLFMMEKFFQLLDYPNAAPPFQVIRLILIK